MIREVDLVSYLPPYLPEYKEMAVTLNAENPEFILVWDAADKVLKNMFIETADEYGISRFEKILSIKPCVNDNLNERRTMILAKWNRRLPYTIRSLTALLERWSLGKPFVIDTSHLKRYRLLIRMFNQEMSTLRKVNEMIKGMIPINLILNLYGEYPSLYVVPIHYKNGVAAGIRFWPRQNLESLKLDGTWKLDGSRKLTGYVSGSIMDFYPMKAVATTSVDISHEYDMGLTSGAGVSVQSACNQVVALQSGYDARRFREDHYPAKAGAGSGVRIEIASPETGVKVINKLDGKWRLDGSRKLNAGVYAL